jgi:hypothetical protein
VVFSDRDGVIVNGGFTAVVMDEINEVITNSLSPGNPSLIILTGSSYEQNRPFIELAKINRYALRYREADPCILFAENGSVRINIFDGSVKELRDVLNTRLLEWLKSEFQSSFFKAIEKRILHKFGLSWSADATRLEDKLFSPQKATMVTVDLPKLPKQRVESRGMETMQLLSKDLLTIMEEIVISSNVPYIML